MEFEAGMAFSKYENKDSGMLDKSHFVKLYKDMANATPSGERTGVDGGKRNDLPQGFMVRKNARSDYRRATTPILNRLVIRLRW